ncbi:hypothetical protein SteCoe_17558 [Stentor coeruleus]|uniref:Uncharacterized protein n=1 Tax=Stentor coeruleus TaxID=5963 RepID=A0A1R2BYP1_9CILI|nr:hypothetical protein SteCoe_17558 [Stentor coeruleus]
MDFVFRSQKKKTMKYLTVDDINDFEEILVINSPRSIEACLREGVKPQDLLFIPENEFTLSQYSEDIKHLHYEFFEAKRKEILANVRKTRKTIISEYENITRSSTAMNMSFVKSKKDEERFLNIKVKSICDMIERQDVIEKSIQIKEMEHNLLLDKIMLNNSTIAEGVKKRNESMFELRNKRQKKLIKEHNLIEQNKIKYHEKNVEEQRRLVKLEKDKLKGIVEKRQRHEAKTQYYYQKMLLQDAKIQELRKNKLAENDAKAKDLIEKIIVEKIKKQKILENKWNAKMRHTAEVKKRLNDTIEKRQVQYYKVKKISDKKFEDFLRNKDKSKEPKRQSSKIFKVYETMEIEQNYKKKRLENKLNDAISRIERKNLEDQKRLEYKKQINSLKKLKQDWNIQRIKNKEEYMREIAKNKFVDRCKKIEEIEEAKTREMNKREEEEIRGGLRDYELRKAIYRMSTSKVWDKEQLIGLLGYKGKDRGDFSRKGADLHDSLDV